MRNKKIHFNHEIVLYSFKNQFFLKMFIQRTKNHEKKRWRVKKSVQKINLTHKQLHQIYIIIKMTSKVKTNILYIASDSSSDQQSQKKSPLAEKLQKINQKNGFALIGHHKLNNNLISKGYFVQNANQQDYEIQKVTESKKISQTVGIRRKSQNKMNRLKTDLPNVIQIKTTLNQKENQQEKHFQSPIEEVPKKMSQKPIDKCQRSKTLMFQFDDKQDDEICNEQIQALKVQCQKIKEDTQQQQKKSTTPETPSIQPDEQSMPQSTKPISITPTNLQQKIDKKQFLLSSIPLGMILQCKIEKKNQIGNFLLSQYDMIFRNYCSTHVVSCKKFIANFRSNYRISADHNDFSYMYNKVLGKVRASPDHKDLYSIYSSGQNPQKTSDPSKVNVRQILCTVRIRSGKGPRQVQIYLLKNGISYFNLLGITLKKQLNLQSLYSIEQNREKIHYFRSRKPQWVSNRGQYFLNFGGRVNQASIRNFILEDPITKNQVMLFGKNQNNLYNIDVSYPLSPFIALGIAIPQLDRDD